MTTPILDIQALVKRYRSVTAVDGISVAIPAGICFGLLGPNGAGKTTALEVIEDIMQPSSGTVLYNGAPRDAAFRQEIGIQFQHTSLLNFMTVRETLLVFQQLYQDSESVERLVEICNLGEILDKLNHRISGGQRQRLLLALALINRPRLVFLDEPSAGLDPQARRHLWDIVRTIKAEGKTIVLTTHYMEEAEYLCDEIAIMDHGKIIAQGSPARLVATHCRGGTISLPRENLGVPPAAIPFPHREVNGRLEITVDKVNTGLEELLALNVNLAEMTVHSPNLEDVFLHLTGRTLRE